MQFRPITDDHDYQFKTKHIKEFLEEGNKVKASVIFRGREMMYQEEGWKIVERLKQDLAELAIIEQAPKMEGKSLVTILGPKPKAKSGVKSAQNENQPQRPEEVQSVRQRKDSKTKSQ
jgi:translation initiation factor IF-3